MNNTEEITDITEAIKCEVLCQSNVIRADSKGANALILSEINPFHRWDGKLSHYRVEHRWFKSADSDVHAVQGNDFIYLTRKEMEPILQALVKNPDKTLFDFFDCCG